MNNVNLGKFFKVILFFWLLVLNSCKKKSYELINGYYFRENENNEVFMFNEKDVRILQKPIHNFKVESEYIFGSLDDMKPHFFCVNTITNTQFIFDKNIELNHYLVKNGLVEFSMKNSFTFLDITTGFKKKTW